MSRRRLPDRRAAETFDLEVAGLCSVCTVGRFAHGRLGEIFLQNHKSTIAESRAFVSAADIAVQCGADPETIRNALCRDSQGRASGPLGAALDLLAGAQ
jgi:hypothetical protein